MTNEDFLRQHIAECKQRIEVIKRGICTNEISNIEVAEENIKILSEGIKACEKQIPYKPKEYEDRYYACKCDNILLEKWEIYPTKLMPKKNGLPHCLACGQKLDWSDE